MGGYTDGEYNGGMAESSADYGGGITYEENQQYKVQGFLGSSSKGEGLFKLGGLFAHKLCDITHFPILSNILPDIS